MTSNRMMLDVNVSLKKIKYGKIQLTFNFNLIRQI